MSRISLFSIAIALSGHCLYAQSNLVDDFTTTQGGNGFTYLAVGDARPINTTNPGAGATLLTFEGVGDIPHGSATFSGPYYRGEGDILPFVQHETNRGFLALHPEPTEGGALGAGVEFAFPNSGLFRIEGAFARANDFQLAGNGVDFGIYMNRDFANPVFESTISSDHVVNPDSPFNGTGMASFDESLGFSAGDQILFAVFTDAQGQDGFFDVTALRGTITAVPEPGSATLILLATITTLCRAGLRNRDPSGRDRTIR